MRKILIFLCAAALLTALAAPAAAVDLEKPCTLTLHYTRSGQVFPGLPIHAYRVADFASDGTYTVTEMFASYPVKIHDITEQSQWREAADTLSAYIRADGLTPTADAVTDEAGDAVFMDLAPGMYVIMDACAETQTESFYFQSFCIFLPTPADDGSYIYDVQAQPKPGQVIPHTAYSLVKLWQDDGNRPGEIQVDILLDGEVMETVTLGTDNDWFYSWTAKDAGIWTVVERNVPQGYTVTVTARENFFTIINTAVPPPEDPTEPSPEDPTEPSPDEPTEPSPDSPTEPTPEKPSDTPSEDGPDTGDRAPLEFYVMTAAISGLLLLLLGFWYKRRPA